MIEPVVLIIALVAFGLVFGTLTARSSERRSKIHGGMPAKISNYLSSAIFATVGPTVLTSIFILHLGIINALLIGISMLVVAFLCLIPYAIVEKPLLEQKARLDKGWTAEDARKSGL